MRAKSLFVVLTSSATCLPSPPLLGGGDHHGAEDSSEGWHEIDPPASDGSLESSGPPDPGAGDSDGDTSPREPELLPDVQLRILELRYDPEGTDGAAESPELMRVVNLGPDPYPLAYLRIEARSWPIVDDADLPMDAAQLALAPGQELVVRRFRTDSGVAQDLSWAGQQLELTLVHDSGLRNSDGAALTLGPDATGADSLCWGEVEQPSPYDDPMQWSGPCVTAQGGALCRIDAGVDTNAAEDWHPCPSSNK